MLDQNDLSAIGALLKHTQDAMMEQIGEKFSAMDKRMDTLEQKMENLEQKMDAIEQRMDAIEQRMDAIEQRMDAIEQRMDAVEQRLDTVEQRLDTVESRLEQTESKLEAAEHQMASASLKISGLDDKIDHRTIFLVEEIERRTNGRFEAIMANLKMLNEVYAVRRLESEKLNLLLKSHEALEARVDRLEQIVM